MSKGNKCLVKDCPNHDNEGMGYDIARIGKKRGDGSLYWICAPCWHMITTGEIGPGESFFHKQLCEPERKLYKGPIEPGMHFIWMKGTSGEAYIEVVRVSNKCPDDPWVYAKVHNAVDRSIIGNEYGNETSRFREAVEPVEERSIHGHKGTHDNTHCPTEPSPS